MDPVTVVGLAASIVSLIEAANVLLEIITSHPQRLRRWGSCNDPLGNATHKQRLQGILEKFIQTLRSAQSVSPETSNYTLSQLKELKAVLESMEKPCQRCPSFLKCIWNCVRSTHGYAKLKEAEGKLQNLSTEVTVTRFGELVLRSQPSIYNEMVDMPSSNVGLDRSVVVMKFLEESQQQELRVIGIHGQAGLGKTTILNKVWKEASSKPPFAARAYVQVGHAPTLENLCAVQSSILEQLGGEKKAFSNESFGRARLKEHFQELRSSNKPMFLAIDNVWEAESLRKLLAEDICSDDLPRLSCIALTSRDFTVVKALSSICHLEESNHLQVFFLSPSCLSPEDSEALFVQSAHILQRSEHAQLLQALVPLCGGLPLALTTLGSVFTDEARREEEQWKDLEEQWHLHGGSPEVTRALELSYQKLESYDQAAVLEVVHFFYGWPWVTVKRIVGASVLQDLESRSLISKAEDLTKCNPKERREGYDDFLDPNIFINYGDYEAQSKEVVAMHDLTLTFGRCLPTEAIFQSQSKDTDEILSQILSFNAKELRNFKGTIDPTSDIRPILEHIKKATNLKILRLRQDDYSNPSLEVGTQRIGASTSFYSSSQLSVLVVQGLRANISMNSILFR